MTGTPVRVAVQEGAATVRVAGAERDEPPWLIAELPAPGPGLPALLAGLVGPPPEELLLVHPAAWSAGRAQRWTRDHAALAGRVRALPAPLAAAGRGLGGPERLRGVAVLDVGASGTEATLLGADGRTAARATADVGGRLLDELVAARTGRTPQAARALREALSLRPTADGWAAADVAAVLAAPLGAAVAALREVVAAAADPPVLLVGGVARTPLLARLVDEAGIAAATVASRPDAAAVLGALGLVLVEPGSGAGSGEAPECAAGGSTPHSTGLHRLPALPVRRRRPLRAAGVGGGAVVTAAALLALGQLLAPAAAVPEGVLVQYGYRFDVPAGWEHTGGRPESRRVLLTPSSAPEGSDLIAVERAELGYDTAAEPGRARAELRAVFDAAVAGGSALSGYDPGARMAGRAVTAYRQEEPGGTAVDWFVVLDRDAQLSVGCRHTAAGAEAVRAACALVVGSVRLG